MKKIILLSILLFIGCNSGEEQPNKQTNYSSKQDTIIIDYINGNQCDTLIGNSIRVHQTGAYGSFDAHYIYSIKIYKELDPKGMDNPIRVENYPMKEVKLSQRYH